METNMQHKYRGKRLEGGGWVEGMILKTIKRGKEHYYIDGYVQNGSIYGHEVDPATVGQATPFRDVDSKVIYQGDKLENNTDAPITVSWNDEYGCWEAIDSEDGENFGLLYNALKDNRYKIINSIHDTPDLLTTKTTNNGNK